MTATPQPRSGGPGRRVSSSDGGLSLGGRRRWLPCASCIRCGKLNHFSRTFFFTLLGLSRNFHSEKYLIFGRYYLARKIDDVRTSSSHPARLFVGEEGRRESPSGVVWPVSSAATTGKAVSDVCHDSRVQSKLGEGPPCISGIVSTNCVLWEIVPVLTALQKCLGNRSKSVFFRPMLWSSLRCSGRIAVWQSLYINT